MLLDAKPPRVLNMKSELNVVMGLYEAIFKDLIALHPSISLDLSRDLSRLLKAGLRSGLPFYTIDLPKISKYLERSLDNRVLDVARPPLSGAKSRQDQRPQFLYGLWCEVFEGDGTLKDNADASAIKSIRQVSLAVKKLRIDCKQEYINDAISAFREIETRLPASREATWDVDHPKWRRLTGHPIWGVSNTNIDIGNLFDADPVLPDHQLYDWAGFGNFVARALAPLGELDVYGIDPKHGPGAVSDRTDHTKYDQRFWTRRLEDVFPYDYFGAPNFGFVEHDIREFPSQLYAVPKTQSSPRLIAAEPTCHQWIQGGLQRWLEKGLKRTILRNCVDFRDQGRSRDLALEASRTREYATVDLSSASDRLTTRLVEFVFQSNRSLLDALHASRTRVVSIDRTGKDLILLRKFSTQGSACTFPVQTIVFSLIAIWAIALTRGEKRWSDLKSYSHQVQVFGDDIILPNDSYPVVVQLLTELQLSVNVHKSFSHGWFRESCGMDAYNGVDVTPAYFRQFYGPAPTSLTSVIECSNNFHKKGMWHTADYVLRTVPPQESRKILVKKISQSSFEDARGAGPFGLISFSGSNVNLLRRRYNKKLQRNEINLLDVSSNVKRRRGKGHGDLNQFFYECSPLGHHDLVYGNITFEDLADLPEYQGGQSSEPRSRKATRWVSVDEAESEIIPTKE